MDIDINKTFLLSPNIFVIYFLLSNKVVKSNNLENIQSYVDSLILATQDDSINAEVKNLKLDKKNCNLDNAIEFFESYVTKGDR